MKAWASAILERLDPGSLVRAGRAAIGLDPDRPDGSPSAPASVGRTAKRPPARAVEGKRTERAESGSTSATAVPAKARTRATGGSAAEPATVGNGERDHPPAGQAPSRRRSLVAALVVSVLIVGVLLITVFPTRTYLSQRAATNHAEGKLAALDREARQLSREEARLRTPAEIERLAREKFLLVRPGEQAYAILPPPLPPIGLPQIWPFAGVEQALSG